MNSLLLSNQLSNQQAVLYLVGLLAVVLLAWRFLFRSSKKASNKTADWLNRSAESGCDLSLGTVPVAATQGSSAADSAPVAASGSNDLSDPSGIVAEVCSLQSPVRESVEESYRGRSVRWTLCLSAISEREGQEASHTVRMHPTGRSPYTCGVYFSANADDCAALQSAGKDDTFVVEGTIAKVEDRDIDLTNVRMVVQKAA